MFFPHDKGIKLLLQDLTGIRADLSNPINSDIIIAPNSWAFRERIRQKGSLVFPFINFRIKPAGLSITERADSPKNYNLAQLGIFDSYLQDKLTFRPFTASYECTYWGVGYTNTVAVFQKAFTSSFKDNRISYTYTISGEEFELKAPFYPINLSLDPQWTAQDELDKGNIHSIDLSFEMDAFLIENVGRYGSNVANYDTSNPCIVTSLNHGLKSGMKAVVGGSTDGDIDGTWTVDVLTPNTFSLRSCNNSGTGKVSGTCQWYSGVALVDEIEVSIFYENGVTGELILDLELPR